MHADSPAMARDNRSQLYRIVAKSDFGRHFSSIWQEMEPRKGAQF